MNAEDEGKTSLLAFNLQLLSFQAKIKQRPTQAKTQDRQLLGDLGSVSFEIWQAA